jgi:hypothetical protein
VYPASRDIEVYAREGRLPSTGFNVEMSSLFVS